MTAFFHLFVQISIISSENDSHLCISTPSRLQKRDFNKHSSDITLRFKLSILQLHWREKPKLLPWPTLEGFPFLLSPVLHRGLLICDLATLDSFPHMPGWFLPQGFVLSIPSTGPLFLQRIDWLSSRKAPPSQRSSPWSPVWGHPPILLFILSTVLFLKYHHLHLNPSYLWVVSYLW